jgi:hypothetical protein
VLWLRITNGQQEWKNKEPFLQFGTIVCKHNWQFINPSKWITRDFLNEIRFFLCSYTSTHCFNNKIVRRNLFHKVLSNRFQVGKIAAKSDSFLAYARRALEKLQLGIQVSDVDIIECTNNIFGGQFQIKILSILN